MEATKNTAAYEKHELMASKRLRKYSDILSAVLVDGRKYTIAEAERAVQKFLKGKV